MVTDIVPDHAVARHIENSCSRFDALRKAHFQSTQQMS
jgi:hypothetical protein